MNTGECPEIRTFGNCSLGELCKVCCMNSNSQTYSNTDTNPILNIKAKEFIPKKKLINSNTNNTTNSNPKSENNSEVENKLLKLNLNANEYVPAKPNGNYNNNNQTNGTQFIMNQNTMLNYENSKEDNNDDFEEPNDDELDMIMKDMMENDDVEGEEESDDEKWFPKFKDCDCCKGFVYKCKGNACQYLGACYCKVKNECDDGN
jgi:hypothetical protein